jgi:hypothetical protein
MQSSTQATAFQNASTTEQDNPRIYSDAVIPKKGLYVWISSDGISQVFSINGLGPKDDLVRLNEVDHVHHIMEPIDGLDDPT